MAEAHAGLKIYFDRGVVNGERGFLVGVVIAGELCGRWRYANFLRRPPGIALHVAIVERLELLDVQRYTIRDVDAGTVYTIARERFARIAYKQDAGYGMQWRAPFEYWDRTPLLVTEAVPAA